jgi:hypothetical protein
MMREIYNIPPKKKAEIQEIGIKGSVLACHPSAQAIELAGMNRKQMQFSLNRAASNSNSPSVSVYSASTRPVLLLASLPS